MLFHLENPTKVGRESMKQREPTGLNNAGMPEQHQLQKAIASTLNTVRGDAIGHKAINFVIIRQKSRHAVSNENNNKIFLPRSILFRSR